ncbi:dihydroxyacetone kinase phosphoryl donor subunit DhaM [Alkalibacterium pelagium]|jgi:dihydroxyacetone kinase phosphotransfer subunit|uniref:phosphoenolpyruvate--glycerone phosphotransferase n=1 Tax=Alkalibacterium pelagium TaxID=426702 RepID=A0A1H7LKI6_9LACT|nr:dihydroxyacetone kinase phosphoryl donor subunit DhaM [Alkalibacterium pelagium]GEN50852.1 PTS-dependent dihydroxyacetone kinase phosphotransferase subunit DhaM [Alkalibacterium pelagium]SEK99503.1 dihydroxyacetone kinase, phosphotransfer subunit [Alkalibacterium pelagium]
MSKSYGVLLVSHVESVASGLKQLLDQVASDVTIRTAGGTEDGDVGTSFDLISETLESFEEDNVLCFYDLGSAKMNLDMATEMTEKNVEILNTAFIEGAYTTASLLQADVPLDNIKEQISKLVIKE